MRKHLKSFLIHSGGMAAVAAALSGVLTSFAVDNNNQSEFCVFVDGKQLEGAESDCVLDWGATASRFLLWFAIFGGALLGPFGLYAIMYGVRAAIDALRHRSRRDEPRVKADPPDPS